MSNSTPKLFSDILFSFIVVVSAFLRYIPFLNLAIVLPKILVFCPETSMAFPLNKTSVELYLSILLRDALLIISLFLMTVFFTFFDTIPDPLFALIFAFSIITLSQLTVMTSESNLPFNAALFPSNKIALFMLSEMSEYSLPINLTATLFVTESNID